MCNMFNKRAQGKGLNAASQSVAYCELDYVLQETVLHWRYCYRLLSTCFHPKQRQLRNLNIVGWLALSGYYFGKEICVGRWEAVQVGKEGESMRETGSEVELQHSQVAWMPVLGEAQEAGELAGKDLLLWEEKLPPVVCVLLCLWEQTLYCST